MVRLDYNASERCLRICHQEFDLEDGFITIGSHLSETMAHLFVDYADSTSLDDDIYASAKNMRFCFLDWRANLYDDDF
jgi:hypothetical protein